MVDISRNPLRIVERDSTDLKRATVTVLTSVEELEICGRESTFN